ncbi:MAG: glycosyltransferase family 2 protein [Pirellula sp.]|jgi:glycosyltransferase involved in cell wall biosynthesis
MQITTVIPAYNAASYISAAIDSALDQDGVDQQIIVIDDGSIDETPSILQSYGSRIDTIRQPNRGLSSARNRGIQAARGKFIAFLDADDVWCQGKLSRQVAALERSPTAIMVHSRTVSWDPTSGVESEFVKAPSEDYQGDCFAKLYRSNAICVSSVMARTSRLREIGGFDEQILRPTTQDYDLWMRIAFESPIVYDGEKGTLYRRHDRNASHQMQMMLEDHIYVTEKALSYGSERLHRELGKSICRMRLADLYFDLGYWHYGHGDLVSAQRCFRSAVRHGRRDLHNLLFAFLPLGLLAKASRRHLAKVTA